jgi:LacI family transcriptional regulator
VSQRDKAGRGATIIDVAARAGVSAMTVSRVINGRDGVHPDTRAAVEAAIAALSYTPNPAARTLKTSAELKIGVIYSNPSAAFMAEFLTGMFEEASSRGARLILLRGEKGKPPAQAELESFAQSGISGVIVTPPLAENAGVMEVVRRMHKPIAVVGAYQVDDAIAVRINDRQAAYEMTRHLLDLGHRRLGLVLGNPDQAASAERVAGFYAAVRETEGVRVSVAQGDFSYASGLAAGETLLDATPPPTAIFAGNDDMAAAVVSVAHRRQLDVPRELTVAGFDDTTAAVTLWPPLTTVHQPLRSLAAEAVAAIAADASAGRPFRSEERILEHHIVKRQSTAAPPARHDPVADYKPLPPRSSESRLS